MKIVYLPVSSSYEPSETQKEASAKSSAEISSESFPTNVFRRENDRRSVCRKTVFFFFDFDVEIKTIKRFGTNRGTRDGDVYFFPRSNFAIA